MSMDRNDPLEVLHYDSPLFYSPLFSYLKKKNKLWKNAPVVKPVIHKAIVTGLAITSARNKGLPFPPPFGKNLMTQKTETNA